MTEKRNENKMPIMGFLKLLTELNLHLPETIL